jgi:hypothetical protein
LKIPNTENQENTKLPYLDKYTTKLPYLDKYTTKLPYLDKYTISAYTIYLYSNRWKNEVLFPSKCK